MFFEEQNRWNQNWNDFSDLYDILLSSPTSLWIRFLFLEFGFSSIKTQIEHLQYGRLDLMNTYEEIMLSCIACFMF